MRLMGIAGLPHPARLAARGGDAAADAARALRPPWCRAPPLPAAAARAGRCRARLLGVAGAVDHAQAAALPRCRLGDRRRAHRARVLACADPGLVVRSPALARGDPRLRRADQGGRAGRRGADANRRRHRPGARCRRSRRPRRARAPGDRASRRSRDGRRPVRRRAALRRPDRALRPGAATRAPRLRPARCAVVRAPAALAARAQRRASRTASRSLAGGAPPQGVDFLHVVFTTFPWVVLAVLG